MLQNFNVNSVIHPWCHSHANSHILFLHIAGLLLHSSSSSYSWPSLNQLHHMRLTRISAAVFPIFLKNFKFTHSSNDTLTRTGDTLTPWPPEAYQHTSTFFNFLHRQDTVYLCEIHPLAFNRSVVIWMTIPETFYSSHAHIKVYMNIQKIHNLKLGQEPTRSTPCSPCTAG